MANLAAGQRLMSEGSPFPLNSNTYFPILHHHKAPQPITLPSPNSKLPNPDAKAVTILNPTVEPIPMKQLSYKDGIPRVIWTEEEVNRMNTLENLQYAVVGKFSYGWPNIEELRLQIPKQCDVKGECKIELLRRRHILMRFSRQDDFINMMSKSSYYILSKDGYSYMMRPLIYDANFSVEEETTQAMAWISFPNLKPTFFVKESIFSMASVVALNDKGTCKKGLQYSEVNTSNTISLKTDNGEDDEVTTKEKATQMEEKDQQHRSTKHWVSKTFAQNNHITENHQKNITDKGKDIQKHTGEGNTIQQMESTKLNATNTGLELVLRNENRHLVAVEQDERRLKKKERYLMLAQQSGPALSSNRYVNTESPEDILDELAIFQEPLQIVGSEQILAIESNSTRDVKVTDGVGEATRKRDLDVALQSVIPAKNQVLLVHYTIWFPIRLQKEIARPYQKIIGLKI
uniref:DUF4283 domain-containing protein n=1 Tax=Solanum tuberosum TaxID=4113 RepID=M1DF82_SOLTU